MADVRVSPRRKMYGTSFGENVIAYYLSKLTDVERNKKLGRWHYDIFLPDFNVVIEYDGSYFHDSRDFLDERKTKMVIDSGLRLIRIKEGRFKKDTCNDVVHIPDGNICQSKYQYALDALCSLVGLPKITVDFSSDDYEYILSLSVKSQGRGVKGHLPETLLSQWDYERNGTITPDGLFQCSRFEVWWKCEKGHSYRMSLVQRTIQNQGCPICSSKRILTGYNDLASRRPDIAKEWHPTKNAFLVPENVACFSNRKAWFICSHGHEFESVISNRTLLGRGCPICHKMKCGLTRIERRKYLFTLDYVGEKDITYFNSRSRMRLLFRCHHCGHESEMTYYYYIYHRRECPHCGFQ